MLKLLSVSCLTPKLLGVKKVSNTSVLKLMKYTYTWKNAWHNDAQLFIQSACSQCIPPKKNILELYLVCLKKLDPIPGMAGPF